MLITSYLNYVSASCCAAYVFPADWDQVQGRPTCATCFDCVQWHADIGGLSQRLGNRNCAMRSYPTCQRHWRRRNENMLSRRTGSANLSREPPSNVVQMVSTVNATKCYQVWVYRAYIVCYFVMQVPKKVKHNIAAGRQCKHCWNVSSESTYIYIYTEIDAYNESFLCLTGPWAILVFYQTLLMCIFGQNRVWVW